MKQTYMWEDFTKERYFEELKKFMRDILQSDCGHSVIFVSRKAYCLFLLFKKKGLLDVGDTKIYTDRLIMKNRNPDLFRGKRVYLVDDSISTGKHLSEIYKTVKERTRFEEIHIKIFLKASEFEEEKFITDFIKDRVKLEIFLPLEMSETLRFCAIETLIFHQENIPYLVELPYLSEFGSEEDYISFTSEQFELIKAGNDNWTFFECNQYGYKQNLIENAVLVMNNTLIDTFPQFIHSFSVRLQITTDEDGTKNIVIAPFAILKSVSFDELISCFYSIFDGTAYKMMLQEDEKRLGDKFPEWSYMAVYRALVYILSYYIGLRLIEFLKIRTPEKELTFQTKNDLYSYENIFSSSIKKIFKQDIRYFFTSMYLFPLFSDVERVNNLKSYIAKYGKLGRDYEIVYLYILALINDVRVDENEETEENLSLKKFLSIEEFQQTLQLSYDGWDEYDIKNIMTRCFCCMLEQSKIANEIIYDTTKRVIYRGFKYADNSESFFDIAGKAFYAAVSSYYKKVGDEGYAQYYEKFLGVLKTFLVHNNLYGNVVRPDVFRIYAEVFRKEKKTELGNQIERLEFLIEEKKPNYIEKLSIYISEVDFWD